MGETRVPAAEVYRMEWLKRWEALTFWALLIMPLTGCVTGGLDQFLNARLARRADMVVPLYDPLVKARHPTLQM